MRPFAWYRSLVEWRTQHAAAWKVASVHGDDHLAPFQRQCEAAVIGALASVGLALAERTLETPAGNEYIRARVEGTALRLWIHDDTAGFDAPGVSRRFEDVDYATPSALIEDFCDRLVRAAHAATARSSRTLER